MRTAGPAIVVALLLGAGGAAQPARGAQASHNPHISGSVAFEYDLAACTGPEDIDAEFGVREEGIAVPAAFEGVVRSNPYHFVVSTLEGGTVCVDTSWMSDIEDPKAEGRFLSFSWWGFEASGHILVDRAGAGTVIDTGDEPVFSPSRRLVAGLQVSEAGWGGLEGFAIWQVTPTGLVRSYKLLADRDGLLPEVFRQEFADWRIDDWVGEDCMAISAASWDALDAVEGDTQRAVRTSFHARRGDGWAIKPGRPEACLQA